MKSDAVKEKTDILVINPGSTTTKIAVFRNLKVLFEEGITHQADKLQTYKSIAAQLPYREQVIKEVIKSHNYDLGCLKAIVGRGPMIVGLKGGGYVVTKKFCEAAASPMNPQHASSLGAPIAFAIAEPLGIPAYIYDSTMGCELLEVAKVSGLAEIEKYGCCHVLNSRAKAIEYAKAQGKKYEDMKLLVCHMGGGISISAHEGGKIIDETTYDDGPMSPERPGGVPLILWTKLCFSGKYTEEEVQKLISGKGGLYSYLGTTDCRQVEKMIEGGNEKATIVYRAMALQIAKAIATMWVSLKGEAEAIILTGGAAHSKMLTDMVKEYAGNLGKIVLMPGESELEALAMGADRIIRGEEEGHIY